MSSRDHHLFFAKQLLPTHAARSPDKLFAELQGPRRDAFLMLLWQEAGKAAPPPSPSAGVLQVDGRSQVARLDVVGALRAGGRELVVLSLPPALESHEALFLALVRGPEGVSIVSYERCADSSGAGVSEVDAVLAQVRADGSRINHGFRPGLDLDAFKAGLGELLGISLDGLEARLQPIDLGAYAAGARASAGAQGAIGVGRLLETLLLVRTTLPLALFLIASPLAGLLAPVWPLLRIVYPLLSLAAIVLLLIWIYQVHDAHRGRTRLSPAMAVLGWFIPALHLVLAPLSVRSAWRAVLGAGGAGVVLLWWLFWLLEVTLRVGGLRIVGTPDGEGARLLAFGGGVDLPASIGPLVTELVGSAGLVISVPAYGLLWYIVRRINNRV